jgi:hypothetical protein
MGQIHSKGKGTEECRVPEKNDCEYPIWNVENVVGNQHKERTWERGYEDRDWIKLAQDCVEWTGLTLAIFSLQFLLAER